MHRVGATTVIALGLLAAACIYDTDHRCGTNEVLIDGLCRCVGGVITGNQCVVIDAGGPVAGGELGSTCTAGGGECTNPSFPSCQASPHGDWYCTTTGCASDADCSGGYHCVSGATPSYCRRPYRGQGIECSTSAECTAFDATYCSVLAGLCLVRDCLPGPGACDPGSTCFDANQVFPGAPWLCVDNAVLEGVGGQ